MSPLIQIRQGFRARCAGLTFLIETQDAQWTCRVRDDSGTDLYTAGRSNRRAAQLAASEFADFRFGVRSAPEQMSWTAYW